MNQRVSSADGRLLGLDLGDVRVGVAMSDVTATLASPHVVVKRVGPLKKVGPLVEEVAKLVDEWEIVTVVVGLPLSLDGSSGPAARKAGKVISALTDRLSVPVVTYDERLTTVSADRALAEAGVDSRKRRDVIDMVAAAIILQGWIDARAHQAADQPTRAPADREDREDREDPEDTSNR